MRTTKPISTVSYNSKEFLTGVLKNLVKAKKVAFWAFIPHAVEEDEHKDHIHLYIEPNGKVDTMDLAEMFEEVDLKHPDKPLKCVDWRSSKWEDWYLYGLHDVAYLRMKFEERKFHYTDADVVASDPDEFAVKAYRAHHSEITKNMRIHSALMQGMTVDKLAYLGGILPQQAMQMAVFQNMFYRGEMQVKQSSESMLREKGFSPVDEDENPYYESEEND